MQPHALFIQWAPPGVTWTPWAKPVLFAHVKALPPVVAADAATPVPALPADVDFAADLQGTCVIIDLPGVASVATGLAMATQGWRPVPLFNAIPAPNFGNAQPAKAVVDVMPTIAALIAGASVLAALDLPADAPPVFLLDADRADAPRPGLASGLFDNRSVSLPSDFPSGNFLIAAGITRIVVLQASGDVPRADLTHTLLRWRDAGIAVFCKAADAADVVPAALRRPRWYRSLLHGFLATFGLHRNRLGGFGGMLNGGASG